VLEVRRTEEFARWLRGLRDLRAKAKGQARVERLTGGNPGDGRSEGAGVSELRIDHGPGYRVYNQQKGTFLLIRLAGGDKSTQARDIESAIALAHTFKEDD
jgi:putative addiction module killer protein